MITHCAERAKRLHRVQLGVRVATEPFYWVRAELPARTPPGGRSASAGRCACCCTWSRRTTVARLCGEVRVELLPAARGVLNRPRLVLTSRGGFRGDRKITAQTFTPLPPLPAGLHTVRFGPVIVRFAGVEGRRRVSCRRRRNQKCSGEQRHQKITQHGFLPPLSGWCIGILQEAVELATSADRHNGAAPPPTHDRCPAPRVSPSQLARPGPRAAGASPDRHRRRRAGGARCRARSRQEGSPQRRHRQEGQSLGGEPAHLLASTPHLSAERRLLALNDRPQSVRFRGGAVEQHCHMPAAQSCGGAPSLTRAPGAPR